MPNLRFSAAARRDLNVIYDYGFGYFGQATADRYAAMLAVAAKALLDFPMMGPEVAGRKRPLRRFSVESHVIYYRLVTEGIVVTRVLHARMPIKGRV